MGRFDEAISEIGKALDLDPLSPVVHVAGALVYYYARQYEKSLEMCQKALELDPNFRAAHVWLMQYNLFQIYRCKTFLFKLTLTNEFRGLPDFYYGK